MRKNKIIKSLIIILLVIISVSFSNISNANLEFTEEKLKTALDNVCGYEKTVKNQNKDGSENSITVSFKDVTYQIDTNKKNITIHSEEDFEDCIVNYNLENSPKFTYNLIYSNDMDAEKVGLEYAKGEYISEILLTVVANAEGILPEDVAASQFNEMFVRLLANLMQIEKDYSNGIVAAKTIYDKTPNISNEYMKVMYEVENETEEEYKVKVTMEISENADFSKMNGSAIKEVQNNNLNNNINNNTNNNTIIDSIISVKPSVQNNVSDTSSSLNNVKKEYDDVVTMANKLLKNNLKESGNYSGVSKYPNAGLETNIFVPIIKTLIGLLVVSLIFMIIKVKKNKKD